TRRRGAGRSAPITSSSTTTAWLTAATTRPGSSRVCSRRKSARPSGRCVNRPEHHSAHRALATRAGGRHSALLREPLGAAPAHDEAVETQQDHRANNGANEACALSGVIPSNSLPEICCNKCADDPQDGGEDEALGLVVARHDELCDDAGNETNDDRPENAH